MQEQEENIDLIYRLAAKIHSEGISEEDQLKLDNILAQSEENQSLWNDLNKTWEMIDPSPKIEVQVDSNAAWNNINSKIFPSTEVSIGKNNTKLYMSIAAAVATIILSFSVWQFSNNDLIKFENTNLTSIEYKLPDNTLVKLEPNSSVKFEKDFTSPIREVSMTGDVFFDVTEDSKPFVIHTTLPDIKVTGTSFCVSDVKGKEVEVSVIEGTVDLINRKKRDQVLSLKKGETMKYVRTKETFEKRLLDRLEVKSAVFNSLDSLQLLLSNLMVFKQVFYLTMLPKLTDSK